MNLDAARLTLCKENVETLCCAGQKCTYAECKSCRNDRLYRSLTGHYSLDEAAKLSQGLSEGNWSGELDCIHFLNLTETDCCGGLAMGCTLLPTSSSTFPVLVHPCHDATQSLQPGDIESHRV